MKKIFTIILLLTLLIGCGAFNKKDLNDERLLGIDEQVDFNATGKYDLSDYLFPSETKTLIYRVTSFNKENNAQNFNETPQSVNNNKVDDYVRDALSVRLNDNIVYQIEEQAIQKKELIDGFYDNRKYRRFLNVGDVYYSYEYVDLKGTQYRRLGKLVCKLAKYDESKTFSNQTYKDILELTCNGEFTEGTIDNSYSIRKNFYIISFYAKEIGLVGSILEKDETTITGDERYSEGRRIETLLSN